MEREYKFLIVTRGGQQKYRTDKIDFPIFKEEIKFYAEVQEEFYDYGTNRWEDAGMRSLNIRHIESVNGESLKYPSFFERVFIKIIRLFL